LPPARSGGKDSAAPTAVNAIPQFAQPLPLLSVQPGGTINTVLGNQAMTIRMCEFKANTLPTGAVPAMPYMGVGLSQ